MVTGGKPDAPCKRRQTPCVQYRCQRRQRIALWSRPTHCVGARIAHRALSTLHTHIHTGSIRHCTALGRGPAGLPACLPVWPSHMAQAHTPQHRVSKSVRRRAGCTYGGAPAGHWGKTQRPNTIHTSRCCLDNAAINFQCLHKENTLAAILLLSHPLWF